MQHKPLKLQSLPLTNISLDSLLALHVFSKLSSLWYLYALHCAGYAYHCNDSANSIVWDSCPVVPTAKQCKLLDRQMNLVHKYNSDPCMYLSHLDMDVYTMTEDIVTCGKCGARTSFEDYADHNNKPYQVHECNNPDCGIMFVVK